MGIYRMAERIFEAPKGKFGTRVCAELRFVLEMNEAQDGKYVEIAERAAQHLLAAVERDGVLTEAAAKEGEALLMPAAEAAKAYTLHCVSHAHIDMNWMWGFQETVPVTLDTFRTILGMLEEFEQFTFSQSQASTYQIAEVYDPQMFEQIKKYVREGRWEVSASTWVEADKNMPSTESLCRHPLYTKRYFAEKFGIDPDALQVDFEPDTFGHSQNVPEILAKAGVKYYYHCRGVEQKRPYIYEAPSGAQVLVYQEPMWYNSAIDDQSIVQLPKLCQEYGCPIGLKVYGVGDHGGGPTRRDIERLIDMQGWPVAPTIVFSSYHRFFQELDAYRDKFPVVTQELNYIFTGCYSTQSRIKAANRLTEDRLQSAEALTAFAHCFAEGYNYQSQYAKAWELVLFNQFHDIITGSGVTETREAALGMYQNALAYAGTGTTKAMLTLAQRIDTAGVQYDKELGTFSEGGGAGFHADIPSRCVNVPAERCYGKTRVFHLFNTTAQVRKEPVELTMWDWNGDHERFCVEDVAGKRQEATILERGDYCGHSFTRFLVDAEVPSYGYMTYVVREREREGFALPLTLDPRVEPFPKNVLENERIRAEFDTDMCLISLVDKESGKELCDGCGGYFELADQTTRNTFIASGWCEGGDVAACNVNRTGKVFTMKRTNDPLRQSIEYTIEFRSSKLYVTLSLDKGESVLRYRVVSEFREMGDEGETVPCLRFRLPVGYGAERYIYQIPGGDIEREDVNHDAPARGYVYAPDRMGGAGAMLLSDTLYGYRGEADGMSVTMIRASTMPDKYPEVGMHTNNIGVGVSASCPAEREKNANRFLHPVQAVAVMPHAGSLEPKGEMLKVEGSVAVTAVKLPEETEGRELIVRCYEECGQQGEARLTFMQAPRGAWVADLLERPGAELRIEKGTVIVPVQPYTINTVRIRF